MKKRLTGRQRKHEQQAGNRTKKVWKVPGLAYRILIYCMLVIFAALALIQVATESFSEILGIVFYVLSAISMVLSVYCLIWDIPNIRGGYKNRLIPGIQNNALANKITHDSGYRLLVSTEMGLALNLVFGIFNGAIGIFSRSAWYGTMAFYYMLLGVMRFWAVRYHNHVVKKKKYTAEKALLKEICIYRTCSVLTVFMAATLGGAVILLVRAEGGKTYPGFTIYAFALYTFVKSGIAIKNRVKASRQSSPILIAVRNIGYVDAFVSILTLQSAMFASFGDMNDSVSKMMNGLTGAAVCFVVLSTGIAGIIFSRRMKKEAKQKHR